MVKSKDVLNYSNVAFHDGLCDADQVNVSSHLCFTSQLRMLEILAL